MVQLSNSYMTIGKTITLTRWKFVGKIMSLLFYDAVYFGHSFLSKKQAKSYVFAKEESLEEKRRIRMV